ncbi:MULTISPECIES: hypothetical protein [Clostridium]|uniref:Uncharacterized protein n=1 Tax=Clostridium disporicum TaxID=84024 RepID=A0A174JTB0_9CLOT|nr:MULTISPECIES: hypothetical protein [Clostridium]MCD2502974.1 hypothetical protein [Clostridium sp. NSJ-145]CUP03013.1 Uncharacterised protein [Clostridium disporicum]
MSKLFNNKNKLEFKKNRKFIGEDLIRYNEDKNNMEFYELMKSGYIEMANINLEISQLFESSPETLQYEFDSINEYEKWLCGV